MAITLVYRTYILLGKLAITYVLRKEIYKSLNGQISCIEFYCSHALLGDKNAAFLEKNGLLVNDDIKPWKSVICK